MPKDETMINTSGEDFAALGRESLRKFISRATKIYERHWPGFVEGVANAENKKGKFNFTLALDLSEPEVKQKTSGRWSEVHIEGADDTFENPLPPQAQEMPGEPLPGVDAEAKAASMPALKAARKGRKQKIKEITGEKDD